MKLLADFNSEMEMNIFSGLLTSKGIEHTIEGNRDYTTLVLGGTGGRYKILVPESDYNKAHKTLREFRVTEHHDRPDRPGLLLKKAVMHAFFGLLILPIVFHYYSIQMTVKYWRAETRLGTKLFWLTVLIFLWFLSLLLYWKMVPATLEAFRSIRGSFGQ